MIPSESIFSRNIKVWGDKKQRILAESCILIAGVGGLGSIVSEILVRSGIGSLIIIDDGVIDPPDLNRQALYISADIGEAKVDAAFKRLSSIHPHTTLIPIKQRITADPGFQKELKQIKFHGMADCLDNFESRFSFETLLDEDSFLVHGGVQNDYGQVTTIKKNQTKSLKELFIDIETSASPLPVCPQIVYNIGSIMAYEILNNLWQEPHLVNTMLVIELSDFSTFKIDLGKDL